jgi:hypothetical protein
MAGSNRAQEGSQRQRRSKLTEPQRWVIVLSILPLTLGLGNLARAALALRYNAILSDVPMTVGLTYLAAMGGLWGLTFVVCAIGLVRFHHWGRWATLAATTLYQAHAWLNHFLFDANDYARQVWPRDAALTLLLLISIWGPLNWPSIRKVFQKND